MSTKNLSNFFNILPQHPDLQTKLREILSGVKSEDGRSIANKVAALSVEAGTPFTAEEFLASHAQEEELSEAELGSVAGGDHYPGNITLGGPICNWR